MVRQDHEDGPVQGPASPQGLDDPFEQLARVDDAAVVHVGGGLAGFLHGPALTAELLSEQIDADRAQLAVAAIREAMEVLPGKLV